MLHREVAQYLLVEDLPQDVRVVEELALAQWATPKAVDRSELRPVLEFKKRTDPHTLLDEVFLRQVDSEPFLHARKKELAQDPPVVVLADSFAYQVRWLATDYKAVTKFVAPDPKARPCQLKQVVVLQTHLSWFDSPVKTPTDQGLDVWLLQQSVVQSTRDLSCLAWPLSPPFANPPSAKAVRPLPELVLHWCSVVWVVVTCELQHDRLLKASLLQPLSGIFEGSEKFKKSPLSTTVATGGVS